MIRTRRLMISSLLSSALLLATVGCDDTRKGFAPAAPAPEAPTAQGTIPVAAPAACSKAPIALAKNEAMISILATNDIHGSIVPKKTKDGKPYGGMAFWSGAVKSIRDGMAKRYGDQGGVLVLDGGDQFQGTLLSNYSEGALMFSLLADVGYDAVVPGNHDYDFGPAGWLVDQVTPDTKDQDPRGVIKKLANSAPFPLLSSNAYLKSTIKALDGTPAVIDSQGCLSDQPLDFSHAERPEFLKSYLMKNVAGLRVAIIGLDNPITPSTTTLANVSDLCFRTAIDEYKSVRESLEGKADVFVLVIHDGDINSQKNLTKLMDKLYDYRPDAVDAVIGGHTHVVNNINKNGVYAIQSGANGERFGRIDLVINTDTKKVEKDRTRVAAGAMLFQKECDPLLDSFCEANTGLRLTYECEPVLESASAIDKVVSGQKDIAPLTGRDLGTADAPILRSDAITESPLLNFLTDTYRKAAGVEVAMINTGGVRTDIPAGKFTYEALYAISPFNNRAVILSPMKIDTLAKLLTRSVVTCGKAGSVLFSGVRVTYSRGDCKNQDDAGNDPTAKLLTIAIDNGGVDGEMLYDARDSANVKVSTKTLKVGTLDFLHSGGSGYVEFKEAPMIADLGIFRELIADTLAKNPGKLEAKIDGRFVNVLPAK
jgi:5'-nucleotidase